MIYINGKCFRNLQEQVEYLTELVGESTDVVKQVVGIVSDVSNLPAASGYALGDTFAVGSASPYTYYVNLNNTWTSIGVFPLQGPQGDAGEDGNKILYTSLPVTSATTQIVVQALSDTPTVGDMVVGSNLIFKVTAVTQYYATVSYICKIEGTDGGDGKSFWFTTTAINGSGSTNVPKNTIYNAAGLTIRAQDLITCSNGNVGTIIAAGNTCIVQYSYTLKGHDGLTTKVKLNGTDYTQVSGTITLPTVTVPADLATYQKKQELYLFYQDISGYTKLSGSAAPTWAADTYYTRSGNSISLTDPITYTLQTSQPADWTLNWKNYYSYSGTAASKTISVTSHDQCNHILIYLENSTNIVTNMSYAFAYLGGTQSGAFAVPRKKYETIEIINNNGNAPYIITSGFDGYSDTTPYTIKNLQVAKASLADTNVTQLYFASLNGSTKICIFGYYDVEE